MEQKNNSVTSAGTNDDSSTKADVTTSSPNNAKPYVSGSAFSVQDLKCGNVLNYDTAEGETLPTVIDWQDLKWLTEDPKGFNLVHSGIELTEAFFSENGFMETYRSEFTVKYEFERFVEIEMVWNKTFGWRLKYLQITIPIKYFHEFQNFYYCLTSEMLILS